VFVRSVRGDRGRWYRDLLEEPRAVLHGRGRQPGPPLAVTAEPAADDVSIARCSAALERSYPADPALATMLEPATLPTTMRLRPADARD
jgi:hypothetical protein